MYGLPRSGLARRTFDWGSDCSQDSQASAPSVDMRSYGDQTRGQKSSGRQSGFSFTEVKSVCRLLGNSTPEKDTIKCYQNNMVVKVRNTCVHTLLIRTRSHARSFPIQTSVRTHAHTLTERSRGRRITDCAAVGDQHSPENEGLLHCFGQDIDLDHTLHTLLPTLHDGALCGCEIPSELLPSWY